MKQCYAYSIIRLQQYNNVRTMYGTQDLILSGPFISSLFHMLYNFVEEDAARIDFDET